MFQLCDKCDSQVAQSRAAAGHTFDRWDDHDLVSVVTCSSSDGGFRGVDAVAVDGFGACPPVLGPDARSRLDDGVHVLHQLQLLPPEILLLDELPPRLVLLLPDALLL